MSKELPLKVRVDIRDLWDSPKSSVTESVNSLKSTLGHTITPRVEWPILWAEVKEKFSDNTVFVPTVVRYAIGWYERLIGRLENEVYEEWTEQFLSMLVEAAKSKAVTLHIEPTAKITVPITKWNAKLSTFQLCVPNAEPVSQSKLDSSFDKCFENLFNGKDDDWADVVVEAARVVKAPAAGPAVPSFSEPQVQSVTRLPILDALARPTDLFTGSGPYVLIVEERGPVIVVQCSHEPSLELVSAYLKKWAKPNMNDSLKRPILKIQLCESEYFYGVFDTIVLERTMGNNNAPPINPTLLLAFVESVLGYKLMNTTGGRRTYASTTLLK
ncbi:hypothetical protein C8F04DRAFT_1389816 [Mycena alexandri]|uniref:Uncharacterized protein n=1 Tax=Mycena alexandri TaxID=1745969 RepID=A0AAD6TEL2_9AGAR|nr:hypothetical protein C8F04DRAFT_1389816 [Mycena alexandri]